MKKAIGALLIIATGILLSNNAFARDDRLKFPIADVLSSEDSKAKLSGKVEFFFGDEDYGTTEKDYGSFTSNKKTNAFNKSDKVACERAMLSSLISLDRRALKEGGNAVVEITSVYRNQTFKSNSEYECGAGAILAGVALSGKVVQIQE